MESKPSTTQIPPLPDDLNPCTQVKRTAQRIYDKSKQLSVFLNEGKISDFLTDLEKKVKETGIAFEPWAKYHIDPNNYTIEQVLSYTFVVDAMNFCFWPRNPPG